MESPYAVLAPFWTQLRTSRAAWVAQRIAIVVIACSLAVMLVGLSTGRGLQRAISGKLTGLWGDIQIRPYAVSDDPADSGLDLDPAVLQALKSHPSVHRVRPTLSTATLVSREDQLEALVYRTQPYQKSDLELVQGALPVAGSVALSSGLAEKWNVHVGDELTLLFSRGNGKNPALRYVTVGGLFRPQLDELDGHWMYGDGTELRKWVDWPANRHSALEIQLKPGADVQEANESLRLMLPPEWEAYPAEDDYAGLYQWLALFDTNLSVVVGVLLGVALFNSAVVVFILLLDQRKNIGILKTMGASAGLLTRLFLTKASRMALWGLLLGNGLALAFCWSQDRWQWIQLDPATYYVQTVPIAWPWSEWAVLNALLFGLVLLTMALPAWAMGRQNPLRSLQW